MGWTLFRILACSIWYLSAWTYGSSQNGNIYELKVLHPHGEHNVMDFIQADETPPPATTEPSTGSGTESNRTNSLACEESGDCCFQYTWPGTRFDNGNTSFTCTNYARESHSTEPCKLPIVFTYQNSTKGNRPDVAELVKYADAHNERIYCRKSSSCIKYSYFDRGSDGTQKLWNETRFCGRLQSQNNGRSIENGCYRETISGYVREVCVCNSDRCNSARISFESHALALLFMSIFAVILRTQS